MSRRSARARRRSGSRRRPARRRAARAQSAACSVRTDAAPPRTRRARRRTDRGDRASRVRTTNRRSGTHGVRPPEELGARLEVDAVVGERDATVLDAGGGVESVEVHPHRLSRRVDVPRRAMRCAGEPRSSGSGDCASSSVGKRWTVHGPSSSSRGRDPDEGPAVVGEVEVVPPERSLDHDGATTSDGPLTFRPTHGESRGGRSGCRRGVAR